MSLLKRFAQGELRLNRIEAFGDGFFAVGRSSAQRRGKILHKITWNGDKFQEER
jgi:hypothetical protein